MENTLDPEFFKQLPIELQQEILSQKPELIPIFFQLNPKYSDLFKSQLLSQICSRPRSEDEINKASSRQRITGRLYQDEPFEDFFTITMEIKVKDVLDNERIIFNVIQYDDGVIRILSNPVGDINTIVYDDLLSYYNVMKNRLNCMNINPNFAKDYILNRFKNRYIRNYQERIKSNNTDQTLEYRVIGLYLALLMNIYVFNIIIDLNINLLKDIPNNLNAIIQDIEHMIDLIQERLLLL